jgi:hypothetical protein
MVFILPLCGNQAPFRLISLWKHCLRSDSFHIGEGSRWQLALRYDVMGMTNTVSGALAETAALLVLRKKLGAIWGKDEDE